MAASAEALCHPRHVKLALAAQAHSITPAGKLAEERRYLHFTDRKHVIHQAFTIFFLRFTAVHLLLRYPGPADVAFSVQIAQSLTQQPHLPHRMGKINTARAV